MRTGSSGCTTEGFSPMRTPEQGRRCRRLLLATICAATMLLAGCVKEQKWTPGAPAPAVSVLDLQDGTVKLSDYRGKVVVLRFWQTGCKACVEGMPALDRFRKKYSANDLAVLGVNIGGSKELVGAFARNLNLSYPVLLDPAMIAAKKYAVRTVPTTYFIDRDGKARQIVAGEIPQKMFDQIIAKML